MKLKTAKTVGTALGALFAIAVFLVVAGVSWIATCGIVKLITLCFGWSFSWGIATGIWLVMFLLKSIFRHNVTVKK